jgi:hypothetical protein
MAMQKFIIGPQTASSPHRSDDFAAASDHIERHFQAS